MPVCPAVEEDCPFNILRRVLCSCLMSHIPRKVPCMQRIYSKHRDPPAAPSTPVFVDVVDPQCCGGFRFASQQPPAGEGADGTCHIYSMGRLAIAKDTSQTLLLCYLLNSARAGARCIGLRTRRAQAAPAGLARTSTLLDATAGAQASKHPQMLPGCYRCTATSSLATRHTVCPRRTRPGATP